MAHNPRHIPSEFREEAIPYLTDPGFDRPDPNPEDFLDRGPFMWDSRKKINPEDFLDRGPFMWDSRKKINPEDFLDRRPFMWNSRKKINLKDFIKPLGSPSRRDSKKKKSTITPIKDSGTSPLMNVAGRYGYIDFNDGPKTNRNVPGKLYRFIEVDRDTGLQGREYGFQLEKEYQGGRWEQSDHARKDFDKYKRMRDRDLQVELNSTWRGNPLIAGTILNFVRAAKADNSFTFNKFKKALEPFNTHRQISRTENRNAIR